MIEGVEGEVSVMMAYDDDKRHPLGFIATNWSPERIHETAIALSEYRRKQGNK